MLGILEVLEPEKLKVGESYLSLICYGCQKMLALMQVAPGYKPEPTPDNIVKVKCTHPGCGAERRYSINERRVRVYEG